MVALLDAIDRGAVRPGELEASRIQLLLSHPDVALRERAQRLLSTVKPDRRQDVVDAYRPALSLDGDAARGKAAFQKICAACHRAEGVGHEIGPNLATVKNRGAEFILLNVLDPSREVNPQYVDYLAVTDDGRTLSGLIASETATSITLRRAEGATDTILRANLEALRSTGQSIMPDGLERQLNPQGMADVIAYLLKLN
jgi:putative heme-binding domain-containing protein